MREIAQLSKYHSHRGLAPSIPYLIVLVQRDGKVYVLELLQDQVTNKTGSNLHGAALHWMQHFLGVPALFQHEPLE